MAAYRPVCSPNASHEQIQRFDTTGRPNVAERHGPRDKCKLRQWDGTRFWFRNKNLSRVPPGCTERLYTSRRAAKLCRGYAC